MTEAKWRKYSINDRKAIVLLLDNDRKPWKVLLVLTMIWRQWKKTLILIEYSWRNHGWLKKKKKHSDEDLNEKPSYCIERPTMDGEKKMKIMVIMKDNNENEKIIVRK